MADDNTTKSIMQRIQAREDAEKTPRLMDTVLKKFGMAAEPAVDFEQARKKREAEDAALLSGFIPCNTPKLVDAAKTTLADWLDTLPPHRLLQPFYMAEMQATVAHRLAAQGRTKTKLPGHTIALALWSLGFQKRRDSGTTRPQTRYWIHPAAQAPQRTQRAK